MKVEDYEPRNAGGLRRWKRRGNRSPLSLQKEIQPCRHFDFSLVGPVLDFRPIELSDDRLVLFYIIFVVICYSSQRKPIYHFSLIHRKN